MLFLKNKRKKQFKPDFIYCIITLFFVVGVIYGTFIANGSDAVVSASEMENDFLTLITTTCLKNLKSLSFIVLFSFSAIGLPAIIYLTYLEGVSLSVSLCFIVISANCGIFKGITMCVPTFLFAVIAFVLISKSGILLSMEIFKCIFLNRHKNMFNNLFRQFFFAFLISSTFMILSGISESLMRKIFT